MAIPRLEGKCIENCPKIYGIATPVLQSAADLVMAMIAGGNHTLIGCALVRNDGVFWGIATAAPPPRNDVKIFRPRDDVKIFGSHIDMDFFVWELGKCA